MPQVELKYSNNVKIEAKLVFDTIEDVINQCDSTAGACKSRAYSASEYKHKHILISIYLLKKPHRDEKFTKSLLNKLLQAVEKIIDDSCYFSLDVRYQGDYYVTTNI